jgi:hypothetical protein
LDPATGREEDGTLPPDAGVGHAVDHDAVGLPSRFQTTSNWRSTRGA